MHCHACDGSVANEPFEPNEAADLLMYSTCEPLEIGYTYKAVRILKL